MMADEQGSPDGNADLPQPQSEEEGEEPPVKLRSEMSQNHAFVRFNNQSSRRVAVYWMNYAGERVRYSVIGPGSFLEVNTYESHPWVAVDAATGDAMLVDRREAYMPVAYLRQSRQWPPQRAEVAVGCPMYSLCESCVQVLRDQVSVDQLNAMTIAPPLRRKINNAAAHKRRYLSGSTSRAEGLGQNRDISRDRFHCDCPP
ncbi:hypothetical protein ACOMHN_066093 [Nucella lapillus]